MFDSVTLFQKKLHFFFFFWQNLPMYCHRLIRRFLVPGVVWATVSRMRVTMITTVERVTDKIDSTSTGNWWVETSGSANHLLFHTIVIDKVSAGIRRIRRIVTDTCKEKGEMRNLWNNTWEKNRRAIHCGEGRDEKSIFKLNGTHAFDRMRLLGKIEQKRNINLKFNILQQKIITKRD